MRGLVEVSAVDPTFGLTCRQHGTETGYGESDDKGIDKKHQGEWRGGPECVQEEGSNCIGPRRWLCKNMSLQGVRCHLIAAHHSRGAHTACNRPHSQPCETPIPVKQQSHRALLARAPAS